MSHPSAEEGNINAKATGKERAEKCCSKSVAVFWQKLGFRKIAKQGEGGNPRRKADRQRESATKHLLACLGWAESAGIEGNPFLGILGNLFLRIAEGQQGVPVAPNYPRGREEFEFECLCNLHPAADKKHHSLAFIWFYSFV